MKMKPKQIAFIVSLACLSLCVNFFSINGFCGTEDSGLKSESSGADSGRNLAVNNDFEEVFKNQPNFWSLEAWMMGSGYTNVYSEKDAPYSGDYYVTIENVKSNDSRLVQDVNVKPSTVYLLSCYVKAQGIPGGKTGANIAVMQKGFSDVSAHYENTSGKWQYIELAVRTCPDQTVMKVAIRLGYFGSDVTGKASFDMLTLVEAADSSNLSVKPLCKEAQAQSKSEVSGLVIIAIVAGLLLVGIIAFVIFALAKKKKPIDSSKKKEQEQPGQVPVQADEPPALLLVKDKPDFTKTDIILAFCLTFVYAVIAFINLGSNEAPETYWRPASRGENVVVDFGKEELIRRIYYWQGLPGGHSPSESKYEIEGSLDGDTWTHVSLINPKTVCWWYVETTSILARYVRITVEVPSSWLNEVVFLGNDAEHPIKIERIIPGARNNFSTGKVENLFDEYSDVGNVKAKKKLVYRPSIMTGMSPGFDEQYHGRTALEHLNYRAPYENTHPPLGKVLMAAGILVFGMNPFGWRFAGTIFGVLIIPLMFAFGKRLFKKTEYAFMAAFLMMFDFMHFTQSRIATIDTYPVFFIILAFYFMYHFCEMSYLKTEFKKMLLPLLLCSISWGLGAASKWTALYAFPGLAIIFFVNLYKKAQEVREAKLSKSLKKNKDEWDRLQAKIEEFPKRAWQLFGWCVLVFTIVPAVLYFLSYVPILMSKEVNWNLKWIIDNQTGMYDYHAKVDSYAKHSYSSRWFQWPIMTMPMAYNFGEGLPDGQTQRLFSFGNPAIWWVGSIAAIVCIIMAVIAYFERIAAVSSQASKNLRFSVLLSSVMRYARLKDEVRFVILIGFATMYLPWVISPRQLTFIYHFFPSVPFIIFCVIYLVKMLREKALEPLKEKGDSYGIYSILGNGIVYIYLFLVMLLFIMFYPIIAGVPAPTNYIKGWLLWFSNHPWWHWYFA